MSFGRRLIQRVLFWSLCALVIAFFSGAMLSIYISDLTYKNATITTAAQPFPIGVNPEAGSIVEQNNVAEFYTNHLAAADQANTSWFNQLANQMQGIKQFQLLASPVSRVFVVWPGERTEQVTQNIGDVLGWSAGERSEFTSLIQRNAYDFEQGFIMPGQYISYRTATPNEVATMLEKEFSDQVTARYPESIQQQLPLQDALIIASLIEREASDFENMREISGVIWNRLFIDMPLQLDASLQYVKAENPYEPNWWPAVRPDDKFIESPFNTYQNIGLPPEPIANPSVAAIVATLNPRITDCFYYFHSRTRQYYCSETYEQHVTKLREVYNLTD